MLSFSLRPKILIAFSFLLILIIVAVLLLGSCSPEVKRKKTPSWKGIVPGETTKTEVIKILGQPNNVSPCVIQLESWNLIGDNARCFKDYVIYQYEEQQEDKPVAFHEIHFQSDTVWFVIEDILPNSANKQTHLENLVEQYGIPEEVIWSGLSPFLNAALFCQHGVIVHANFGNGHEKVQYFEPRSLEKCLQEFSREVATNNPFSNTDIITVKDPWGFDK